MTVREVRGDASEFFDFPISGVTDTKMPAVYN
jgi:hypothetical protein